MMADAAVVGGGKPPHVGELGLGKVLDQVAGSIASGRQGRAARGHPGGEGAEAVGGPTSQTDAGLAGVFAGMQCTGVAKWPKTSSVAGPKKRA